MRRHEGFISLVVLTCLTVLLTCSISNGRIGPGGKVRVFCFGDVIEQYGSFNSYAVIQIDPAVETTLVPTRLFGWTGEYQNIHAQEL